MLNAQLCTQKTQIRTTTTHRPLETNTCQTTKPTRHAETKQSLQKININATIAHLRARTTNGKPQKQSNQAQTQPPAQNINTETRTANTRPKIKSRKPNGQSNHQSRTTEHTNNMSTPKLQNANTLPWKDVKACMRIEQRAQVQQHAHNSQWKVRPAAETGILWVRILLAVRTTQIIITIK